MVITQRRSKISKTGSKYIKDRKKRLSEKGNAPTHTKIAEKKIKAVRTIGGNLKLKLASTDKINVYNPKTKKHSMETIKAVVDNKASVHFIRRNIITKGAVLDTTAGKVQVTNRPGQDGLLNGILVE